MDHMFFMDTDFDDDIECCRVVSEEAVLLQSSSATLENPSPAKVSTGFDLSFKAGKGENLGIIPKYGNDVCRESVEVMIEIDNKVAGVVATVRVDKQMEKEKRKSLSAKKPPKPPRPPRGLSLDAADQMLIKEFAELSMMKRARIERIKALKKMKTAKASSSSGSLFAMLCTVIFCVVIICQGLSSGNNAAVSVHSSLVSAGPSNSSSIAVHDPTSLSAIAKNSSHSEPPNLVEDASALDTENFRKRTTG